LSELGDAVPAAGEFLEEIGTQFPGAEERIQLHELQRRLIDHLMRGLMEGSIAACEGLKNVDGVRRAENRVARFAPRAAETSVAMKAFLHRRVYHTEMLVEEREKSALAIEKLFNYFLENPQELPVEDEELVRDGVPRRVCDYLASMTDQYFERIYGAINPK
jgi:dGTPase